MKINFAFVAKSVALSLFLIAHPSFGQGALNPTNSPVASMKSLDQIEPRIDIATLSGDSTYQYIITQPGSYYLSGNLTPAFGKSAISIRTNDVTIDLCGFTIYANGGFYGISCSASCNRPQVANGRLVNFRYGINFITLAFATNAILHDLQIVGVGILSGGGIMLYDGAQVSRCQVMNYSISGSYGLEATENAQVDHCKFERNATGISLGNHSMISDCMVRDASGSGIIVGNFSIVRNNEVYSGGISGVSCSAECLVENNNCNFCAGGGIYLSGSNNRVEGNQTHFNTFGVQSATSTTNMVVRNFAHGNTNSNYSFIGPVLAGPTFNGLTTLTNHPWANFSY